MKNSVSSARICRQVNIKSIGEAKMKNESSQVTPILEIAWTRYAQMDAASKKRTNSYLRMRRWITAFGVLATLFAILTETFPASQYGIAGLTLQFLLILSPLLASGLAAYAGKFLSNGDWLITRAGAEEIKKEIYTYRTVLRNTPTRNIWLEKRLAEIQRSVYRGLNGELTMAKYQGPLPPHYSPDNPLSDSGFQDLTGDEYFRYRLENQLGWHNDKVIKRQAERTRLQVFIILSGIIGAILAMLLPLWVALAASFTAAFIGWQELRNLDSVVRNYSKVIIELNILYDHWKNLTLEEQTQSEFFKLVRSTEEILWSQNVEYIKAMQEALKESDLEEEASLVNRVIKEQRDSDHRFKQGIADSVVDHTQSTLFDSEETLTDTYETAVRTLAEEASSDIVQAELAAMRDGAEDMIENVSEHLGISSELQAIQEEFADVEIGPNTPMSVVNEVMSRYPKTIDVKG